MEPLGLDLITILGWVISGAASAGVALGFQARRRRKTATSVAMNTRVETVDPVTGLPARYRLVEQLSQRLADRSHNRGCGVLVCAPDHLSALNEALGHHAGDEVLAAVGSRIRPVVRGGDLFTRYVGHQLAIVATDVPSERDLTLLANRLIEAVAGPVALGSGKTHQLTLSVGIAAAFDTDPLAENLLRDATLARRKAEQAGGNQVRFCTLHDREQAAARYELERDLKVAMVEHHFEVNYQPVVDLDQGVVLWFESLVRWRHPRRGLLHPISFLDQVADLGLATALNRIMISEACRQAAAWSAQAGRPIRVSVNTSAQVLVDPELVATVEQAIVGAGLVAGQLLLEIDQAALEEIVGEGRANLERLVGIGVGLVVDNARAVAGLSWPSTSTVGIKVDHGWLAAAGRDTDSGLDNDELILGDDAVVVATGVERADQLDRVRSLGVTAAQGFWLQRPADAEALAPLIERGDDGAQSLLAVDEVADASL